MLMKICVAGSGYVGLVAGACFADSGNTVIGFDIDKHKISSLNNGKVPIFEPGLEEIVQKNLEAKRLSFTTDPAEAIPNSDLFLLAVGTPQGSQGEANLSYLLNAVDTFGKWINKDCIILVKSTVPVGTADRISQMVGQLKYFCPVVSNPEFLKEGTAIHDFLKPERVILGSTSSKAISIVSELYSPFVRSGNPILVMSNRSAELAKYAANSFLAMRVSFINEIALLSERFGADIEEVRKALTTDSRIGNRFLYPGCGYGGSCFPKDVQALIRMGHEQGLEMPLFHATHNINERQKLSLFEKMKHHYQNMNGKKVALWGLSFKPLTNDIREAPSVALITQLLKAGATVRGYDPAANAEIRHHFGDRVQLYDESYSMLDGADGLAILTEWNEFRTPDFSRIKSSMSQPTLFDGRNLFDPIQMRELGFDYFAIGRGKR